MTITRTSSERILSYERHASALRDGENLGLGMGQNPFINPIQRGIELPQGCKDLMDVLKAGGMDRSAAGQPTVSYGTLSEIPQRVATFLESGTDPQFFSAGLPQGNIFVILQKRPETLTLNLSLSAVPQSVKDAVSQIFQNPKFENIFGMEYVSVALNPANDSVASSLMDLLTEGFDVIEGEQLMFVSYRPPEANR